MTSDLTFRVKPESEHAARPMLDRLGSAIIADALLWRSGLQLGQAGPVVGPADADIVFEAANAVSLIPLVYDAATLDSEPTMGDLGEEPTEPWTWLRAVVSSQVSSQEAATVAEALEPAFDRRRGLEELDALAAAIVEHWATSDGGFGKIAAWAAARETDRRQSSRRLAGLRRRYDRDLLIMADRLASSKSGPSV